MKADVKSSGIAASVAQPHQPGGLGVSLFPSFSYDLRTGANIFMLMLAKVNDIGNETHFRHGDGEDGRDYRLMCFEIETALLANLLGSGQVVRQGFLRAMVDYLSHTTGNIFPSDDWNGRKALTTTAAAFVILQGAPICTADRAAIGAAQPRQVNTQPLRLVHSAAKS